MRNLVYLISEFILLLSITFMVVSLVRRAFSRQYFEKIQNNIELVNREYLKEILIRREKKKKLKLRNNRSILYRLGLLIDKASIRNNKFFWFLNPQIILLMCICTAAFTYALFESFFKVVSVSLMMAVPGFFIPITVLSFMAQKKEADIERVLGNFILQLKNNTKIHNDIIEAFRAVQDSCIEPLRTFTGRFLAEVNSGISVEEALQNFKDKVDINRFKLFLTNIEYCYTYGGDFTELLDKTQKLISEIQREKKHRTRETRSARLVLFILIGLDLFLYFNFIKVEPEYMNIMRTTFFGQMILNFNFISIWFLLWLSYSVKKLDY